VQHLARLLGRGRAMEAILGADDFGAEQAERYGWINFVGEEEPAKYASAVLDSITGNWP
jgi:enoyl-CoA hydratase/carnithine racemase